MKLFTKYNRLNLTVTISLLLLSAVAYYLVVNYILIYEMDEELENYKEKIESFASKSGGLPEKGVLEDLRVTYEASQEFSPSVKYLVVHQYDSGEGEVEAFRQLVYFQRARNAIYKVTIGKPLEGAELLANTIIFSTIGILVVVILISLLLNRLVLKKLWQPFYESIKAVKNFKLAAPAAPKLPLTKIEEFTFLNDNLHDTFRDVQTDYRLLKEFTENASHEIQTPLAIIRSKLDLLIQEESLSERQGEILDGAYAAVKRISKLSQSLLLLAKIENNQFAEMELIDLKKELSDKMEQYGEFWQSNHIQIDHSLESSFITANKELVDILLNNLLGNAGMHNREGGRVNISLSATHLTISNTGTFQSLDKTRLFSRFYKEAQHTHHNGLGLSIVKQICEQSGIRIEYRFQDSLHIFSLTWDESHLPS